MLERCSFPQAWSDSLVWLDQSQTPLAPWEVKPSAHISRPVFSAKVWNLQLKKITRYSSIVKTFWFRLKVKHPVESPEVGSEPRVGEVIMSLLLWSEGTWAGSSCSNRVNALAQLSKHFWIFAVSLPPAAMWESITRVLICFFSSARSSWVKGREASLVVRVGIALVGSCVWGNYLGRIRKCDLVAGGAPLKTGFEVSRAHAVPSSLPRAVDERWVAGDYSMAMPTCLPAAMLPAIMFMDSTSLGHGEHPNCTGDSNMLEMPGPWDVCQEEL